MKQRESIYIIGEGETERYYFKHLKNLIKSYNCIVRPRLFSNNTSIFYLEKKTNEFIAADVTVICVFDADVAERNEKEKKKFKNFIRKYKDNKKVIICDSLPSIEFWFLLHFKTTSKYFTTKQLRDELKKHIPDYDKKEKYLKDYKWVKALVSKQYTAIKNAKSLNSSEVSYLTPSQSYSNVYKAIERLEKTKNL